MTFQKSTSAGFLANHMARLFASALQKRIEPLGIAPAQFMVLLELWEEDGLTQRDLVARLAVEQATMANTLKRMERDGLIQRRPSETDKRARIILLSDTARALRQDAVKGASEVNAKALAKLEPGEQQELIRLMRKVVEALQRG
jgi:DNA-binding MarR family transcriptional regulator